MTRKFQGEHLRTATSNSAKDVVRSDSKPTVVYKPMAKVVSKSTLSILANMVSKLPIPYELPSVRLGLHFCLSEKHM